jgi:hypothetical protein
VLISRHPVIVIGSTADVSADRPAAAGALVDASTFLGAAAFAASPARASTIGAAAILMDGAAAGCVVCFAAGCFVDATGWRVLVAWRGAREAGRSRVGAAADASGCGEADWTDGCCTAGSAVVDAGAAGDATCRGIATMATMRTPIAPSSITTDRVFRRGRLCRRVVASVPGVLPDDGDLIAR